MEFATKHRGRVWCACEGGNGVCSLISVKGRCDVRALTTVCEHGEKRGMYQTGDIMMEDDVQILTR
jgi:hypothetical protein